ncbi:phosphoribosyl-ATP diphosphatase [bacterium]|nr:phosphoribosyl-ATP diphosphatase [bacterium]
MSAPPASILQQLAEVIEQRKTVSPAGSYTAELFAEGHAVMSSKVIEEAYELVTACGEETPNYPDVVHEAADVIYHLMVLLAANDVAWRDVERELTRRFGTSGLVEKARRGPEEA